MQPPSGPSAPNAAPALAVAAAQAARARARPHPRTLQRALPGATAPTPCEPTPLPAPPPPPAEFCEKLLESAGPRFAGPIAILRNWSYCLFYVMAELWGSVVVSVLFWGFANQVRRRATPAATTQPAACCSCGRCVSHWQVSRCACARGRWRLRVSLDTLSTQLTPAPPLPPLPAPY